MAIFLQFLIGLVALLLNSGCRRLGPVVHAGHTKTIAFVRQSAGINHIWLMEIDSAGTGHGPRRLTSDTEAENYPSWSPDGRQLAFQRDLNGSAIYLSDITGSLVQRISPNPGFDATPSWSPDGSKIIYTRVLGSIIAGQVPSTEIHVMNADGSADRVILPASPFSVEPRWSVRNQIVFMSRMKGGQQLFRMNSDGTGIRQLTQTADNGDPAWSPDGNQISFGSDREGGGKLNIFIMNADGGQVVQLTHFQTREESGDSNWSPDGKLIVFEYDINGHLQSDPNAPAEVWTMAVNGTQEVSSRVSCSGVGCAPRWRPD